MNVRGAIKLLSAASVLGARNTLRTIRYALLRDRLEVKVVNAEERSCGALEAHTLGNLRFAHAALEIVFLTEDLVRLTWTPGALPIDYAIARKDWPPVAVTIRDEDGVTLSSAALTVRVARDGAVTFLDARGVVLRSEDPPVRIGDRWKQRAPLGKARVFGLGMRAAPLDLRGRRYALWNNDPAGSYGPGEDPLYVSIPVYIVAGDAKSYLVFHESTHEGSLDLTSDTLCIGGALRTYFTPGPPARALERYTELTGRAPLPPRWALGFHQSRWGYESSDMVRDIAEGFRRHELPLSAIHIDFDYMDRARVFTVGPSFRDLDALTRELETHGVRIVTILEPCVAKDRRFDVYRALRDGDALCKLPNGKPLEGPVWPGWSVFPDFTAARARDIWRSLYARLLDRGVAGIWHDMNEPAVLAAWGELTFPRVTRHALEGRGGDHREAHNVYGMLMNRTGYEALREAQPDKRPFILSRAGFAGSQRWAWSWTGDSESTWAALRQTIPTVLGLGLSGVPYSGPDVGGFAGAPSAELFLRWFELAAFMPFFRTHSSLRRPPREPWRFGAETLAHARELLRLRYRLMPYLYTLAWQASETGAPLVRPMGWPNELQSIDDQFMLGDALLVAPIVEEGATARDVTLPAGRWYALRDADPHDGSARVRLAAPLGKPIVLVRAGSIVPMERDDVLELHVHSENGTGTLYSDAGDGYGDSRVDTFVLHDTQLSWTSEGTFAFPYRAVELHRVTRDGVLAEAIAHAPP